MKPAIAFLPVSSLEHRRAEKPVQGMSLKAMHSTLELRRVWMAPPDDNEGSWRWVSALSSEYPMGWKLTRRDFVRRKADR